MSLKPKQLRIPVHLCFNTFAHNFELYYSNCFNSFLIYSSFSKRYFVSCIRQLKLMESAASSPIFSHFNETQTGVNTIRAFKVNDTFIEQMQTHINSLNQCKYSILLVERWQSVLLEFVGNLVTILATLFAILARGTLSPGLAALSITTALGWSGRLNFFVWSTTELEAHMTSFERIKEYFHRVNMPEAEWSIEEAKPPNSWPHSGHIVFKNFSLRYHEGLANSLSDISFEICSGERIGIVGRTGAGKSSLTLGLFRMVEGVSGQILIDNVDISHMGLHDLRRNITIIPQVSV